jgi:hypothetical protein
VDFIISLVKILLLFILPANIILLFLLNFGYRKKIEDFSLLIFSYGIGPLANGLLFYYLIWFFPEQSSKFYLMIISILWVTILSLSAKRIIQFREIYKDLFFKIEKTIGVFEKKLLLFLPVLIVILFSGIQALFYPVVDNDSALYLKQSEAVYENKNLKWQKKTTIIINKDDEYRYNSSIRPGVPSFIALSYLIKEKTNHFVFKFLSFYYYILLLSIFLVTVYVFSKKSKVGNFSSLFFGSLFFTFSWILTRSVIFNSKEPIIYFFALASIFLLYKIIDHKSRNLSLEILLGVLLGLNIFVNLHGIVIGSIIFLILIIFSKLSFWERTKQVIYIFSVSLFLGAFEFIFYFKFIFLETSKKVFSYFIHSNNEITQIAQNNGISSNKNHQELYQVESLKDLYLKGKLQILTNIGVFGFYPWVFLMTIAFKSKKIINLKLGGIILSFLLLYFLIVIDPFNLNKHEYSIILCGSTKYASLLVLLTLVVLSVYTKSFGEKIIKSLFRARVVITCLIGFFILILLAGKSYFISSGTSILLVVINNFKDVNFYQGKVEIFYNIALLFCIGLILSIWVKKWNSKFGNLAAWLFLISFFVLTPFFITDVGKVSWKNSLRYISSDLETKLIHTSNDTQDIFKVYFYAKKNLPPQSIMSGPSEIYVYDDHFKLVIEKKENKGYYITRKNCPNKTSLMFESGAIKLCKNNK